MNQHSSRSHALLTITVQGTDLATGTKTTGQLQSQDMYSALHKYSPPLEFFHFFFLSPVP